MLQYIFRSINSDISSNMKCGRLLMLVLSVVVLSLIGIGVRHEWKEQAREKREVGYQSALRSYAQILKPGMARKQLEDYLRTKNTPFSQMCCIDTNQLRSGVWYDLTKVGEEDAPWYCSRHSGLHCFPIQWPETRRRDLEGRPFGHSEEHQGLPSTETCL